jgi:hypothetical protein
MEPRIDPQDESPSSEPPDDGNNGNNSDIEPADASTVWSSTEKPSNQIAPSKAPARKDEDDLVNKGLQFLSTATPRTLGAIAVGLVAVTYFVLGQVGLLLIGAFTGITLFASWESRQPETSRVVSKERGYDLLERLLQTKTQPSALRTEEDEKTDAQAMARSFDDFQPETREALNNVVDAVIRDYVDWWYAPIVPSDKSFSLSCRKVLTTFILNVSNHLTRKRPADAFVDFLTNCCSIIIVFFAEMTAAYSSFPLDDKTTAADAIYNYLSKNTDAPLSNLLNQKQQAAKFKTASEDLLNYLERSSRDCDPARTFLGEIIANVVLEGTLGTCSKAEWINGWIVYLLEAGETDLSQAIDEAIQDQKAFADIDGNFGNISLAKGNRNSYDMERARKKESAHKSQPSKADTEMEHAMEEMKKLNEMIAEAEKAKASPDHTETVAAELLDKAIDQNAKELDLVMSRQSSDLSASKTSNMASSSPKGARMEALTTTSANTEGSTKSSIAMDRPGQDPMLHRNHKSSASIQTMNSGQAASVVGSTETAGAMHQVRPHSLYNANLSIYDDSDSDKGRLRSKPTWDYFVQIEPAASQHPGWMAMKTYTQFEALHESLRRIAAISGANNFLEAHAAFPGWRTHTRASLRGELETYIRSACAEKTLAESEAMKRFLEKGQDPRMNANRGLSLETMGKGVLDAVQSAPTDIFDGGKAMIDGVTGVLGKFGLGQRKSTHSSLQDDHGPKTNENAYMRPVSLPALPRMDTDLSMQSRASTDSQRSSVISVQPGRIPSMEPRTSLQIDFEHDGLQPSRSDRWERNSSLSAASSRVHSRAPSMVSLRSPLRSPSELSLSNLRLPPPPHEISDEYESPSAARKSIDGFAKSNDGLLSPHSITSPSRSLSSSQLAKAAQKTGFAQKPRKKYPPVSEQETRVAVELLFAVINELYTLSSAWNIRRTLLMAAKSFLIRPGNTSLGSIQKLIQESILDANTSDSGIATYLKKLRENSLPTEEELKTWPAELKPEEREELRVKARKLFIKSGVPAALMGIMGQSATNEALGRVFDCLQIEEVARGLFFGIMLQVVRVVTH